MQGRPIRLITALILIGAVIGFPVPGQREEPQPELSGTDFSAEFEGALSISVELECNESEDFETRESRTLTASLATDDLKKLGPDDTREAAAVAKCRRIAQSYVKTVVNKALCPPCSTDPKSCQPFLKYEATDLDEAIKLGSYSESGTGQLGVTRVTQECWVEAIEYKVGCGECSREGTPTADPVTDG